MNKENSSSRIGETSINKDGCKAIIIRYRKAIDMDIQYDDGTIVENTTYSNFTKGSFKNPCYPSIYGIGYMGQGKYTAIVDGSISKAYDTWHSFLRRSYWKGYHASEKSYKDVTVCEEWHNFQNFAEWFYEKYNPDYMEKWQLDKDIICADCKVYNPENCRFVPQEVNTFFIKRQAKNSNLPLGVSKNHYSYKAEINVGRGKKIIKSFPTIEEAAIFYKIKKEIYAKELAHKWRDIVDEDVYEKLINYQV